MSKKSIGHDEALRQAYAADPMQAVIDMHELARQANELEDRVKELEAENAALKTENALWRERVQMRQTLVEQYEKDIAALKRELAGEMEKY